MSPSIGSSDTGEKLGESSRHVLNGPEIRPPPLPSSAKQVTGSWQPLPYIYSGFAVYPYRPSGRASNSPRSVHSSKVGEPARSPRQRKHSEKSATSRRKHSEPSVPPKPRNPYEVGLDVGDEFFAFEEYRCAVEEDGRGDVWYRGYVVRAAPLRKYAPVPSTSSEPHDLPHPQATVQLGIFPAAVVHIRSDDGAGGDAQLAEAYMRALELAEARARATDSENGIDTGQRTPPVLDGPMDSPRSPGVIGLGVQDRGERPKKLENRKSLRAPELLSRSERAMSIDLRRKGRPVQETEKEHLPIPTLTAGDYTITGACHPLVDEIACAIRDWYARLPTYLANREYRLFGIVMQHIDALLLGRRQLLAQVLSADEMRRVIRECVTRLVKCNVAQGLEVVVRSLEDGSVMVWDRDRSQGESSWMSGIQAYVYQVQFAYIDSIGREGLLGAQSLLSPRLPTHFASKSVPAPLRQASPHGGTGGSSGLFHCLLDVRAFIASPCSPGETAELYFSLYSKHSKRFLTEEYCLVLNHLGSPARDAEQRLGELHAIFTNLKFEEVTSPICLVCKIVRNGALRMRADHAGSTLLTKKHHRKGQSSLGTVDEAGVLRSISTVNIASDDSFSVTSARATHGRMNSVETSFTNVTVSSANGRPSFRRPLGCAVLEIAQLRSVLVHNGQDPRAGDAEFTMPIYVPEDEASFATLHEDIMANRTTAYTKSSRLESVVVDLKLFQGSTSQIVSAHPALLSDVPACSRLGFADIVFPGDDRNDVYVQLGAGRFAAAMPFATISTGSTRLRKSLSAMAAGNIQISLEVRRNDDGLVIPGCISAGGAGEPPVTQYHSMVYANNDNPVFRENIKVSLPSGNVDCHLFLSFRSRGAFKTPPAADPQRLEVPFAHATVPIFSDQAAVQDGSHDLILYRLDDDTEHLPQMYLQAPWSTTGRGDAIPVPATNGMLRLRDQFSIRTLLCSTSHSQDSTLRTLLRVHVQPDSADSAMLESTLAKFGFVSEEEIVKFVPALLDSLLAIMDLSVKRDLSTLNQLAMQGFVKVLSLSHDRRFDDFEPVYNAYLAHQYCRPSAAVSLLHTIRVAMRNPTTTDFRAVLKVWGLCARLVARAHAISARQQPTTDDESDLPVSLMRDLLHEMTALTRNDKDVLIGTQTLLVQRYPDAFADMIGIFGEGEALRSIVAFIDAIPNTKATLATYKLLAILQVVRTFYDVSDVARATVLPSLIRWVRPHLRPSTLIDRFNGDQKAQDGKRVKWLENCRLAGTVVALVIDKLERHHSPKNGNLRDLGTSDEEGLQLCLHLLPFLCAAFAELSNDANADALARLRSSSGVWRATPEVFPSAHPFALISDLAPAPRSVQDGVMAEDGLSSPGVFNAGLAEIANIMASLILAVPRSGLLRYFADLLETEGPDACSAVFLSLFAFGDSIAQSRSFPVQWVTVNLMTYHSMIKLFDVAADIMTTGTLSPPGSGGEASGDFDHLLWQKCLSTLCSLLALEALSLEDLAPQRRRAGWIIAGDLRDTGADILQRLIPNIRRHSDHSWAPVVGPVTTLCLSSNEPLRVAAANLLVSIAQSEFSATQDMRSVDSSVFVQLVPLTPLHLTVPGESPHTLFISQLRAIVQSSPAGSDIPFIERFTRFVDDVEQFVTLLAILQEVPQTTEWKDERAEAIVQILQFARRTGRSDLYSRFVQQLSELMLDSHDWLGTAYALKLEADAYDWTTDGDLVGPLQIGKISLPEQTQFARREALYYLAIDYFTEAEAYESALALCQELVKKHQSLTLDVHKLSELSAYQAKLWEKMGEAPRHHPEYFRVAYYGDFPSVDRDKEYIVRGQPWQRYQDFCDALRAKHPSAKLHKSKVAPSPSAQAGGKQIWVTAVTPELEISHPALQTAPQANVAQYYKRNGIRRFTTSRPLTPDGTPPKPEAVGVLGWAEKVELTTAEELPGLLARSEVIEKTTRQVSPVAAALDEVERATRELESLAKSRPGQPVNVKQLGTAINGAVDSPVNGGIKLYRDVSVLVEADGQNQKIEVLQTFLENDYLSRYPDQAAMGEQLQNAIEHFIRSIREALTVHKILCPDLVYHEALWSRFHKAYPEEATAPPRLSFSSVDSLMIPDFPAPPSTDQFPSAPASNADDHATEFHHLVLRSREQKVSIISHTPSRPSITISTSDLGTEQHPSAAQSAVQLGPVIPAQQPRPSIIISASDADVGDAAGGVRQAAQQRVSISLSPEDGLAAPPNPRRLSRGSSTRSTSGGSMQRPFSSFMDTFTRRKSANGGGGGGMSSNRNSMASVTTLSNFSSKREGPASIRSHSTTGMGRRSSGAAEGGQRSGQADVEKQKGFKRLSTFLRKAYGDSR